MANVERSDRWTLGDIDEGHMAASAFIAVGDEEFYRTRDIFNLMGLPVPEYGAYYSQPNSDRAHLTDSGLVLTVLYRRKSLLTVAAERIGLIRSAEPPIFKAREARTDDVLQPLLTIPLTENAVLEINAGVARVSRNGEAQIRVLKETLKKQGLRLTNYSPETVGSVPDADEKEDLTIACNRRAFVIENQSLIPEISARQDRVFGEVIEDLQEAHQSGRQERFRDAFKRCARIASLKPEDPRRVLVPYWTEQRSTVRQQEVALAARIYARQCSVA